MASPSGAVDEERADAVGVTFIFRAAARAALRQVKPAIQPGGGSGSTWPLIR
jgi:hypothetical protein